MIMLKVTFFNLLGCPWCKKIQTQLKEDFSFKTLLEKCVLVQWTTLIIKNSLEKIELKQELLKKYDITLTTFPAFLIENAKEPKPYLLTGSDKLDTIKLLLYQMDLN